MESHPEKEQNHKPHEEQLHKINLNEVGLTDFWKKCYQLEINHFSNYFQRMGRISSNIYKNTGLIKSNIETL